MTRFINLYYRYRRNAHCSIVNWAVQGSMGRGVTAMSPDTFEFDAFAGGIYSLGKKLDETGKRIGMPRPALTGALHKHYRDTRRTWEADFWANAHSDRELSNWIWKDKKPNFDSADEEEFVELSDRIPTMVREGLIEIAKGLPGRHGGKARAFNMKEAWEVRSRVLRERGKGLSKKEAYRKVAGKMKRSEHTIRRTCEPQERKRSGPSPRHYDLLGR
jgi:hypothetical protein